MEKRTMIENKRSLSNEWKKGEEQKNNHHRTTPLDGCIYTFWSSEEGSERELARENTQRIPRRYNENTSVHEIP